MGQYRSRPDHPGNYIDRITDGVGQRGSSLSDVDRLTIVHNGIHPPRFLFQELKWERESLSAAAKWWLGDLDELPGVDVWVTRVYDDGTLEVTDRDTATRLDAQEYRDRFGQWWNPADPSRRYPLPEVAT